MTMIPRLHLVTTADVLHRPEFTELSAALLSAAGEADAAVALHLRGRVSGRRLHILAQELRPVVHRAGGILLINDRLDVALTAAADGVQLPAHGLTLEDAHRVLAGVKRSSDRPFLIGESVHSVHDLQKAAAPDFVVAGNVWATESHPEMPGRGLDWLRIMAHASEGAPVIAIGGVSPSRAAEAIQAGAHGVGVLSGIWSDPSPEDALIRYLEALNSTDSGGGGA